MLRVGHGWQRRLVVALVLLLVGASCGSGSNEPLVLVSRQSLVPDQACIVVSGETTCTTSTLTASMRTNDGIAAELTFREATARIANTDAPAATCGGRDYVRVNLVQPQPDADLGIHDIEIADGRSLTLEPATWLSVQSYAADERDNCFEATGRWRGTGGDLLGRSGTYERVDNGLQARITLSEGPT